MNLINLWLHLTACVLTFTAEKSQIKSEVFFSGRMRVVFSSSGRVQEVFKIVRRMLEFSEQLIASIGSEMQECDARNKI